jgi:hypothetical protein
MGWNLHVPSTDLQRALSAPSKYSSQTTFCVPYCTEAAHKARRFSVSKCTAAHTAYPKSTLYLMGRQQAYNSYVNQ